MKSLQLSHPHLLVMIGIPGSGKSTFASRFAETFNAPYIQYAEIQRLVPSDAGGAVVNYVLDKLFSTKQTLVIDGPGEHAADRRDIIAVAHKHGYEPLFIWVQTEQATAEQRAIHTKGSTMTKSQFSAGLASFEAPNPREPVLVISGKHTYQTQARTVLRRLVGEQPVAPIVVPTPPPSRGGTLRGRMIR